MNIKWKVGTQEINRLGKFYVSIDSTGLVFKNQNNKVMVNRESAIKEIKGFVGLCKKNGLVFSKVLFFGSAANGSATEDSDIDVMLFSDKFSDNVIENKGMISRFLRNYYNLDIKAYPSDRFEKGGLLIDEVKKNGLEISL